MTGHTPAEAEAEAMFVELVNGMGSVVQSGIDVGVDGTLRGENTLMDGWDQVTQDEATGYFYSFAGISQSVGGAYAGGVLAGGMHGVYQSLKVQRELAWRAAFPSMLVEASVSGSSMGNRLGGFVFSMCVADAFLRELVIRNARKKYLVKRPDPESIPIWERDSRVLTPLTAFALVPAVRWKRNSASIAGSTLFLSAAMACYTHMWTPEKYFDIRKAWDIK